MKVVMSTDSQYLDDEIAVRFGRGKYLIFLNTETGEYETYPNLYLNLKGEVDSQLVKSLSRRKIQEAVSGYWSEFDKASMQKMGINTVSIPKLSCCDAISHLYKISINYCKDNEKKPANNG